MNEPAELRKSAEELAEDRLVNRLAQRLGVSINQTRARTKNIYDDLHEQLKQEVFREIKATFESVTEAQIHAAIMHKIREFDVIQILTDRLDELMERNFEPIVESAYVRVSKRYNKSLLKSLARISSLKTSTIQEIQENVRKDYVDDEANVKEELLNFPEYKEAMRQIAFDEKNKVV